MRERAARFLRNFRRASKRPADEPIHDLRVSVRRLATVLHAAQDTFRLRSPDMAIAHLDVLMRPLGKLRDAQVERERLAALGKEDRKALAAVRGLVDKREAKFRARARRAMKKLAVADLERRCRRVRAELEASLVGEDAPSVRREVAATAHRLLLRLYPSVRAHRRLAIQRRDIRAFHKMRLALKRLRYTAESLRPALPGLNKARMKRFSRLQTYMGDVHDFDVLIGSVKEHYGPESSSAVWKAVHRLARQRERLFGQFVRAFRRMEKDPFWIDTA